MTVDITFGEWLKRHRRQLDVTQIELAEQVGCSAGTIQKIEQDLRRPSKQLAELLADQLDIPLEQQSAFITFARTEAYTPEMSEALAAMGETPPEPVVIALKEEKMVPAAAPQPIATQITSNLPLQATPFIGRETELAELDTLIANPDVRLVTIVGAGGMGKTRLALAAAERQLHNSSSPPSYGVFFVDLARLDSGEQIIPALTDALNFPLRSDEQEKRTPKQQILDYLRRKQVLLVMDNFEHLLAPPSVPPDGGETGGAALVADILQWAHAVQVLATSRERLQLQGEHLFAIQGLEFPDWETPEDAAEYTAVKLFLQSARRLRRNFQLREDDLTYLSRICRLVEGMPLAVELAAGWVDLLSLAEIAAELAQSLDMLATEMRNVPQRQHSLRAVFDTSWGRLSQPEQSALMGFSLFRGGCTREAAQAVTGASLRTLANLSNKSLIQYRQRNGRYQIHTLLRQYAAEKVALDKTAETAARDAHCAYYCAALEQWESVLKTDVQTAVKAMHADYDNIRIAWEWAVANLKIADLTRGANSWSAYFDASGRLGEGEAIFQEAVAVMTSAHPVINSTEQARLYIRLKTWQIKLSLNQYLSGWQEDYVEQEHLLKQNLSLLSDWATTEERFPAEEAFIRLVLGHLQLNNRNRQIEEGGANLERGLHLYQQLGDKAGEADALFLLGGYHYALRALEQAREFLLQSLANSQEIGDFFRFSRLLFSLTYVAQDTGDFAAVLETVERWSDVTANLQNFPKSLGLANLLLGFSSPLVHLGRFAEAQTLANQALPIYDDLGAGEDLLAHAHTLAGFPPLYLGQYAEAREQAQRSLELYGTDHIAVHAFLILGWVALAEEAYAEATEWLLKVGHIKEQEVVHPANRYQAKATLAYAERGLGQLDQAKRHLFEVLKTTITDQDMLWFLPLIKALSGIALLLADQGHTEHAVEVYTLASTHPMVANGQWFEDVAGRHIRAISATLPPDVVRAAEARGQASDLWEGSVALLAELEALGWGV